MKSIPHPLHKQIATLLIQAEVKLSTRSHARLCWLLWAVLLSGTVVQRQIARTLASISPNHISASSHERRLRRAVQDTRVCWENVFAPLARFVLRKVTGAVTIIVDESGHTDVVRVLTAALWYQGRAIPLAWIVWKAQTARESEYWQDCQTLLKRVASVLPHGVSVSVVADRAFGCPAFLDPVARRGWHYVVRVQGQTRLEHRDGTQTAIKNVLSEAGKLWSGRVRAFKKHAWRDVLAIAYWRHGCDEPLLLVSSLGLAAWSVRIYRTRSAIEALFRDWKSYGLRWEASQVRHVAHHEHLILVLALATIITLLVGCEAAEQVLAQPPQTGKRRPWAARDSLFGLGRDRLWQRLWLRSEEPLPHAFAPPGTQTWSQRCWHQAAPEAKQMSVKNGRVCHHR